MKSIVQTLDYKHPSMYAMFDMTDENWGALFSGEERQEIQGTTETSFDYPSLPLDMEQFLRDIPNTNNLNDIYRHLEARPLDPGSEAHLVFLKFCLQASLLLFKSNYFPIANHKERDICTNVWHVFGKAFNDSVLNLEIEQASNASKEVNNKKRKIAANSQMSRQKCPLIPGMAVLQGEQEYAIIEVSNSSKHTNEGPLLSAQHLQSAALYMPHCATLNQSLPLFVVSIELHASAVI